MTRLWRALRWVAQIGAAAGYFVGDKFDALEMHLGWRINRRVARETKIGALFVKEEVDWVTIPAASISAENLAARSMVWGNISTPAKDLRHGISILMGEQYFSPGAKPAPKNLSRPVHGGYPDTPKVKDDSDVHNL